MKTKSISLVVLSFGVCTLAMAAEYKSPDVGFKKASPSHRESKVAEFNEDYKVEGAVETDRQIASEEESDREPSSVLVHGKKKAPAMVEEEKPVDEKVEPTPWLYRTNREASY